MELRHLRYFVAVAEELNFSRAAGRMYLSQPALSQQIRKLEQELGVALFQRTKKHVALTEAGQVLLEGARRVLVLVEQTSRETREVGGAEGRHLRVGFPEYANHTPVADALQTFRRRYPYVELEEHETFTLQETLQQIDKLHKGTLDIGFMLRPEEDELLEIEHVLDIELVAALPEGHPLAGREVVSLRAVGRTPHPVLAQLPPPLLRLRGRVLQAGGLRTQGGAAQRAATLFGSDDLQDGSLGHRGRHRRQTRGLGLPAVRRDLQALTEPCALAGPRSGLAARRPLLEPAGLSGDSPRGRPLQERPRAQR